MIETVNPNEWMIRLKLADGTHRAGAYLGSSVGKVYVCDRLSGEVLEFKHADVLDYDVRKGGK